MRRATLVALALGMAAVALLGLSGGLGGSREGELVFSPESVDLGRVPLGRLAPARFEMRNVGDRPVKIVATPGVKTVEGC
ncbi:MAG: hypothetical protein ACM3US_08035 [Sphingomonadaceae bacterium]